MASLSLSIVEIIVLMLGAIVLGITIHFFITSRRNLKASFPTKPLQAPALNEWKLKYFNEVEVKDKEIVTLRKQYEDAEENKNIFAIEAEEMRRQNKKLLAELEAAKKNITQPTGTTGKQDYYTQLRETQAGLSDHNEKISQLLENIDLLRSTEEQHRQLVIENEELFTQVKQLRQQLALKDQEVNNIRQKANLSSEMSSMLDNAYSEFSTLQEKMHKLETQVNSSKMVNMDFEEMKEEHFKLRKDYEEQKQKLNAYTNENRDMKELLHETEDKLREANFQRQQLQKRVAYLEEINSDLQEVSEANKRLESQIKRIGELESRLNMVSEERDQLREK